MTNQPTLNEPIFDIAHLGHIELLTPKPEESLRFFVDVMGMTESGRAGSSVFLHGFDDYERYSLKLTGAKTSGLGHMAFRTRTPQALERRAAALAGSGFDIGWTEGDIGHGKTFVCRDPDGPCGRTILRHRVVRSTARTQTGAEKPGATLSRARRQRAPARSFQLPCR